MKKRKAMDEVTVSKEFLRDLMQPFHPIKKIFDISVVDDGRVVIFCEKGGVENTP